MIDREALDELSHSIGDDRQFLRELVDTYLDDAPDQIEAMRVGVAATDVPRVNRAAHTLKSNSLSVGATDLAAMCRELEALTQPATTEPAALAEPDIGARVDAIAAHFELVRSELDALVPVDAA